MNIKKYVASVLAFLILLTLPVCAEPADTGEGTVNTEELKAWYVIGDGVYDDVNHTQTYQVYLAMDGCSLYTGTFGISYSASLDLSFELDTANFRYFQVFDESEVGSNVIAFQWLYVKDVKNEVKDDFPQPLDLDSATRVKLGEITIENVVLTGTDPDVYPSGWNTESIRQLDWLTTDVSQTDKYTRDLDGYCLNDEIWRAVTAADESEGDGDGVTGEGEGETVDPTEPTDPTDPTDPEVPEDALETEYGYYQGYDMTDEEKPQWIDIGFIFNSGYDLPEKAGKMIFGQVYSYNPNNPVSFTLYMNGAEYTTSSQNAYSDIKSDGRVTCTYNINITDPGDYILEVKKDVHLTYKINVTVPSEQDEIPVEEITLYCGDISADEKIKQNDRSTLQKYLNMQIYAESDTEAVKSDLNGDGKVTLHDLNILKTYYNKSYKEVE